MDWASESVLITGGTGSFGRRATEWLLHRYRAGRVVVFSRDEHKQHDMRTAGLDHPSLRYFLGDVRDLDRLRRAMRDVTLVLHAAALKHVPACEYNPNEAVLTNVMGARNVIEAALDCRVARVIALSTDKAVNPTNLYGATKLVAEKLFVQANAYRGSGPTRFSCVRYGNVLGSRGSVVPLFQAQRATGTLTITDRRMTRFVLTVDEAVRFVLHCAERMQGGEIFIPKVPSVSIFDLARAIGPECQIEEIGIRPGEKLHELLISEDESRLTREFDEMFVIQAAHPSWTSAPTLGGQPLAEGTSHRSDKSRARLSIEQIHQMLGGSCQSQAKGMPGHARSYASGRRGDQDLRKESALP